MVSRTLFWNYQGCSRVYCFYITPLHVHFWIMGQWTGFQCGSKPHHSNEVNMIACRSSKLFSSVSLKIQLVGKLHSITTCKVTGVFQCHFYKEKGANASCEFQRIGTRDRSSWKVHHNCFQIFCIHWKRQRTYLGHKKKRII